MRLDKFLKVSRIIKRRTIAKEASDKELVMVNGKVAKPSYQLKIGDIITVTYFKKQVSVKVINLKETVKASEAESLYELIEVVDLNK